MFLLLWQWAMQHDRGTDVTESSSNENQYLTIARVWPWAIAHIWMAAQNAQDMVRWSKIMLCLQAGRRPQMQTHHLPFIVQHSNQNAALLQYSMRLGYCWLRQALQCSFRCMHGHACTNAHLHHPLKQLISDSAPLLHIRLVRDHGRRQILTCLWS